MLRRDAHGVGMHLKSRFVDAEHIGRGAEEGLGGGSG
jgi:hypothetical protein